MNKLFQELEEGAEVVTATRRLAREITRRYTRLRTELGETVWDTPAVMPWGGWLARNWEEARLQDSGGLPQLLGPVRQQILWERAVAESPAAPTARTESLARLAQRSWDLVQAWRISERQLQASGGSETEAFLAWCRRYRRYCREGGWIDEARLAAQLRRLFAAGRLRPPGRIVMTGFLDPHPQQTALLGALAAAGTRVSSGPTPAQSASVWRCRLADQTAELTAAARQARAWLAAQPDARIGIVVPGLETCRERVERIFAEVLTPGANLPGAGDARSPATHLSLGLPLPRYPMIAHALDALRLGIAAVPLEVASRLLRGPFLAGGSSNAARHAQAEICLRGLGCRRVDRKQVSWACLKAQALELHGRLDGLPVAAPRALPSQWVVKFTDWLTRLGWPGERRLSSQEYQLLEHWRGCLDAYASLDGLTGPQSAHDALIRLERIATAGIFQARDPGAPVEVLGVLEAVGLEFDAVWICGMHDEAWPQTARPDPLLPLAVQRQARMPGCSAERELEFQRRLGDALLATAPRIILSWPALVEDRPVTISPLFATVDEVVCDAGAGEPASFARVLACEGVALEPAPAQEHVPLGVTARAQGGTRVLQDQANCPFRAFAIHRLDATELERPAVGLDPARRGSLAHLVLQRVWEQLDGLAALQGLTPGAREACIEAAVTEAIETLPEHLARSLPERHIALERARLQSVVGSLLELEARRSAFHVARLEERQDIELAGLGMTVRLDRMDRLPSGELILIDYKTGRIEPGKALSEPVADVQLPLYAISQEVAPVAVVYASLAAGEIGFHGVAADEAVLGESANLRLRQAPPKRFNGWADVLAYWRTSLTGLAKDFLAGRAAVEPRPGACRLCHLTALCRIHERPDRRQDR